MSALTAGAAGINGDDFKALLQVTQINSDGTPNDPHYREQVNWVRQINTFYPNASAYTAHHLSGNDFEIIASAGVGIHFREQVTDDTGHAFAVEQTKAPVVYVNELYQDAMVMASRLTF